MAQLIVAHRGASRDAPENTLAAFRLAFEQQADGIEADFRLTSDGQIVCIHDKDTGRTANKKLIVAKSTLEELRKLDVGSWKDKKWQGEKIATLAEVLESVPPGKMIFIELKTGPKIVEPMVKVIGESKLSSEQIMIICFNKESVTECKKRMPKIKVQWLTGYKKNLINQWTPNANEVVKTLRATGADMVGSKAETRHLNDKFLSKMRAAGYRDYGVWTVDKLAVAKFYKERGAFAITTNRPAWLREQLFPKPVVLESLPVITPAVPRHAPGNL